MVLHVVADKRIFSSDGAMWTVCKLLYCTSVFVVRKFTNSLQHKMDQGHISRGFSPMNRRRFWARRWSESLPIVSSLASCLSSWPAHSTISWISWRSSNKKANFSYIIPLMTSLGRLACVRTLDQLYVTWGVTWLFRLFSKVVNKPSWTANQARWMKLGLRRCTRKIFVRYSG